MRDLLATGERSFSFEFFPPKDDAGVAALWKALRELESLRPTFVSVTYGAGGSSRDTTIEITQRIARETTMTPMAHLTCVGHTRDELRSSSGRTPTPASATCSPCAATRPAGRAPRGRRPTAG